MKRDLQSWLYEYALSHKNTVNQKIHTICVPAITFSIIGILYSISFDFDSIIIMFLFFIIF